MPAIFISYRRDDSEGQAGRLYDDLSRRFGESSVFMDVAAIEPGRDFRKVIDQNVASCSVLLVLIGPGWLDANDEAGQRRLDHPTDFVRLETASALKRDIPVVPVLVHGARMPRAEQLPEELRELAYRNGLELSHARWDTDVEVLVKALQRHINEKAAPAPGAGEPANTPQVAHIKSRGLIAAAFVTVAGAGFGLYLWLQDSTRPEAARQSAVGTIPASSQQPPIPQSTNPSEPRAQSQPQPSQATIPAPRSTVNTSGPRVGSATPSMEPVAALIALVPIEFRDTCQSVAWQSGAPSGGIRAGITCYPSKGPGEVRYYRFFNGQVMQEQYEFWKKPSMGPEFMQLGNEPGTDLPYSKAKSRGRRYCVKVGYDGLILNWTNDDLLIAAEAHAPKGNVESVFRWWQSSIP